jgi:hypothetical protein
VNKQVLGHLRQFNLFGVVLAVSALLLACGADQLSDEEQTTQRDTFNDNDLRPLPDTSGGGLDVPSDALTSGADTLFFDTSGTSGTTDNDTSGTSGNDTSGTSGTTDGDTSGTSGNDTSGTSGADTSGGGPTDRDGDTIPDTSDNCPDAPNFSQSNFDNDTLGDACDPDLDGDSVPNASDNCPQLASSNLTDTDSDSIGDMCDPDLDGDGIPNAADLWPSEGGWPTPALPNTVYAHSSTRLYYMDVYPPYQIVDVADFGWPANADSTEMTDIAIDRNGVIYGVSFDDLFVCRADNAQCRRIGGLPSSFNGLTWMPAGTVFPDREALIGIANDGRWFRLDIPVGGGNLQAVQIGAYSAGYTSSGDAFSIEGVGTFGAVNKGSLTYDYLLEVNATGGLVRELGPIGAYSTIYGVAGWSGKFFGFDSTGAVILIDLNSGTPPTVTPIHTGTGIVWWGAGVRTVIVN